MIAQSSFFWWWANLNGFLVKVIILSTKEIIHMQNDDKSFVSTPTTNYINQVNIVNVSSVQK